MAVRATAHISKSCYSTIIFKDSITTNNIRAISSFTSNFDGQPPRAKPAPDNRHIFRANHDVHLSSLAMLCNHNSCTNEKKGQKECSCNPLLYRRVMLSNNTYRSSDLPRSYMSEYCRYRSARLLAKRWLLLVGSLKIALNQDMRL